MDILKAAWTRTNLFITKNNISIGSSPNTWFSIHPLLVSNEPLRVSIAPILRIYLPHSTYLLAPSPCLFTSINDKKWLGLKILQLFEIYNTNALTFLLIWITMNQRIHLQAVVAQNTSRHNENSKVFGTSFSLHLTDSLQDRFLLCWPNLTSIQCCYLKRKNIKV